MAAVKKTSLSITDHLINSLKVTLLSQCKHCLGLGFVCSQQSGFLLCSCMQGHCQEDKDEDKSLMSPCLPPYERYSQEKKDIILCECREARINLARITHLEKASQIPPKYRGAFLEDISTNHVPNTSLIMALSYAEEIVFRYAKREKKLIGLYLYGGTGCGKTMLCCALLNELIRFHKTSVRFAKIGRDIIAKLRSSYNPNSGIYGEGIKIEERLSSVPVLLIDDFGMHRETEWVQSVLYNLIDTRYENDLLTLITSNDPMSFWKDTAGGRVYSRLREMCREIHIKAPDYRAESIHKTQHAF